MSQSVALLLTGTVLLLAILAASPAAHHWVHSEAGQQEHGCAITLFAHGVAAQVVEIALAVVVWLLLVRIVERREVFVPTPAFSHLPGRAPPVR